MHVGKSGLLLGICAFLAFVCLAYYRADARRGRMADARAIERVIVALQQATLNGEGKIEGWKGDVADLGRLGIVPPEAAAADAASKTPRPFHGYYFLVMEPEAGMGPAFFAYPADPDYSDAPVIIVRAGGSRRAWRGFQRLPVQRWPSDAEIRTRWSTYACG